MSFVLLICHYKLFDESDFLLSRCKSKAYKKAVSHGKFYSRIIRGNKSHEQVSLSLTHRIHSRVRNTLNSMSDLDRERLEQNTKEIHNVQEREAFFDRFGSKRSSVVVMYAQWKECRQFLPKKKAYVKFYSNNLTERSTGANKLHPKPFCDIPGPKSLPIIGTLYKYLPLIGEYSFTKLYESGRKKLTRFGPLIREEIVPNVNVVWVYRPEDISEIFKAESGLHPERRSHLALLKYRKDRTDVYKTGGLLPTNGPEWWRLRKEFQKVSSKPQDVINYLEETDRVIQEFVELCTKEQFDDLLPILSRLFLELNHTKTLFPSLKYNTMDHHYTKCSNNRCIMGKRAVAYKKNKCKFQNKVDVYESSFSRNFTAAVYACICKLTCLVVFDVRLNSFSKEERREDSISSKLIKAAFETNSAILKLDNGLQLWRFFETPLYRKLRKAQTFMETVALDLVSRKIKDMKAQPCKSFLSAYLENPTLDIKDIVGMACDMLLAGIDTTTYSTAFALYHLAKNQNIQEKLQSEVTLLLDHRNPQITIDVLRKASYTKAVIKESLRLNPISVGIGRILQTDVVLNGYQVPKGTVVVTQNQIICRLPEYFIEPDSFIPERWLRGSSESTSKTYCGNSVHPFVVLPFGHGPRSCIARRFAEQNMQVLLLRICQRIRFSWNGDELGMISLLINKPNAPLKFKFDEILKADFTHFQSRRQL